MEQIYQYKTKDQNLINGVKNDRSLKKYLKTTYKKEGIKEVKKKMEKFDQKRAEKIGMCGNWFEYEILENFQRRLVKASFCKDKLCPICQAKSSSLEANQLKEIHNEVELMQLSPYHLTFTLKGRHEKLETLRKEIWKYFQKFRQRKYWKERIEGYFASFEAEWSEEHGWKVHLHVYMVFNKLVPREMAKEQWQKMLQDISDTWFDITGDSYIIGLDAVKNVFQFTKYVTKPQELLDLPDDKFQEIANTMKGKRIRTTGGVVGELKTEFTDKEFIDQENEQEEKEDQGEKEELKVIGYERWKWDGRGYTIYILDNKLPTKAHTPGGL